MSYVPDANMYGMLSDLGKNLWGGIREYQQKQLLSELGQSLMGGDYNGAAQKALAAGDMGTGLKLLELGQQKQNAAALPGLLQGPQFGASASPAATAPQQTGDGSGGDYFKKLAQVESGGNPNAVSPTGARGIYQFIPSTWRQYAGAGADINDPQAQNAAVQRLTADNRTALTQALGREPTAGELYLAHQQGAGGAIKLLSNPGATPAELGLARNVAVNGGNPNAPAAQFVQKWTSKFDGVGSPFGMAGREQTVLPTAVANAQPRPAQVAQAASEDDGEEDKPAAGAQTAQGAAPAVPNPAQPKAAANSDGDNAAKIAALRNYQATLTTALATQTAPGPKAAIEARLQQVKDQLAELKPDKEKYQIIRNDDGSITAVNKTDPSQFQNITVGKPKSQMEYETRKTLADDMQLIGSARTGFLANGKIPDQIRVLRRGDKAIGPTGETIAENGGRDNSSISDQNADFLAERVLAGDKQALVGLGRGAQGAADLAKVQSVVAQKAKDRGISASDMLYNQAKNVGLAQQERTFGGQIAAMATASVEAQGALNIARTASGEFKRPDFKPMAQLYVKYEDAVNSPQLSKFAAANMTVANTMARAINPKGTPTVEDKKHFYELLSTAKSDQAYNATLDQFDAEINLAHQSPTYAQKMLENIRKGRPTEEGIPAQFLGKGHGSSAPAHGSPSPAALPSGKTKSGVTWSIE